MNMSVSCPRRHYPRCLCPLFFLADKQVRGFLRGIGIHDFDLDSVRRNSIGNAMYLSNMHHTDSSSRILIVKENGSIEKRTSHGKIAFLDDQQTIVAWINDFKQGVSFRNDELINGPIESFDIDYGGNYFIVRIPKSDTQIFGLLIKILTWRNGFTCRTHIPWER